MIIREINQKIKAKSFPEGSLILERVEGPHKAVMEGKLVINWEGPFRVKQNLVNRAYQLKMINRKSILRTWNGTHL